MEADEYSARGSLQRVFVQKDTGSLLHAVETRVALHEGRNVVSVPRYSLCECTYLI